VHRGDLASEAVPDAEVFRAPSHALPESDQTGGDTIRSNGRFNAMDISSEVHFDASCEIEATFDGCMDESEVL
jgi:hypothetical protein